jgi:hypothetical protein
MRLFTRSARAAVRRFSTNHTRVNGSLTSTGSGPWRLRSTLVLGGLGLSMLAFAQAEFCAVNAAGDAQCDARFSPAYSGEDVGDAIGFTVPLDGEKFEQFDGTARRAKRVSCASYKANFPIEDKFDVHASADGDVYALVLDGHGKLSVIYFAVSFCFSLSGN